MDITKRVIQRIKRERKSEKSDLVDLLDEIEQMKMKRSRLNKYTVGTHIVSVNTHQSQQ